MILCALDFESTGLDREKDRITEVGAILWSTGQSRTLETTGFLVKSDVSIPEEVTRITGITNAALQKFGYESDAALDSVIDLMGQADAIIGQNVIRFDKRMLEAWAKRENKTIPNKLWIDTRTDLEIEGKHLQYMCADEGWLNLFEHSAVADCQSVLKLISKRDINKIVERAQSPTIVLIAHQKKEDNELAKKRKFRWSPANVYGIWWRAVKELDKNDIIKEAPFNISVAPQEVLIERLWYPDAD